MRAALLMLIVSAAPAAADEPLRFRWLAGESLKFDVVHTITVTETARDPRTNKPAARVTVNKTTLARRWDVKSVDAAGVGTLELVITALRQEQTKPGNPDKAGLPTTDITVADSSSPDFAKTDEGKAMAGFLNKPILTAKVDARGQLVEVTAATGDTAAAASLLRIELPFRMTLPAAAAATWDRTFVVKLDPPFGTGETYDATQTFAPKAAGTIGVNTTYAKPPTDPGDRIAAAPYLWAGEVYFDAAAGKYRGAKLVAKSEILNHAGDDTKFEYHGEYVETAGK